MPAVVMLVAKVAGAVLLLLGLTAGALYSADVPVEADIVEKRCVTAPFLQGPGPSASVTAKTRLGGIRKTVEVRLDECVLIPDHAYVVYHLRTKHTLLYESKGGECVYDSTASRGCG